MKIRLVCDFVEHLKEVNCVSFGRKYFATCSGDKSIRVYKVADFSALSASPLCGHTYTIHCCTFSPVDDILASCSIDGRCILWRIESGSEVKTFSHMGNGDLRVCCFSSDGRKIATGSNDETLCIWDINSCNLIMQSAKHEDAVVALAFSPDGTFIVSGTPSGDLRVWDAAYGHCRCLLMKPCIHDLGISCLQFAPISATSTIQSQFILASCGKDNLAKVWLFTFKTGCEKGITLAMSLCLAAHKGPVVSCCFSPDGLRLATASCDKTVKLWNSVNGQIEMSFVAHESLLTSCAYSHDGRFIATASVDKTVRIWSIDEQDSNEMAAPKMTVVQASPTDVNHWSVEDVYKWIYNLLSNQQIADEFRRQQVDGNCLLLLTSDSLTQQLNIGSIQIRNKILHNIRILKNVCQKDKGSVTCETVNGMPYEFLCPITLEPLKEPVIAADGFTYEGHAIRSWLSGGNNRSPMTNEILPHNQLLPNHNMRMVIERYSQN